jgi:hypothetical protein
MLMTHRPNSHIEHYFRLSDTVAALPAPERKDDADKLHLLVELGAIAYSGIPENGAPDPLNMFFDTAAVSVVTTGNHLAAAQQIAMDHPEAAELLDHYSMRLGAQHPLPPPEGKTYAD